MIFKVSSTSSDITDKSAHTECWTITLSYHTLNTQTLNQQQCAEMASDECSNVPTDNCCQQEQQHSRNETAKQLFIHI